MDRRECGGWAAAATDEIYECPHCGNHVCARCARKNGYLCPNCFAKLCGADN